VTTALAVSVAVLWVTVGVLAVVVLALARQVGVLHERVAPAGALLTRAGPAVGDRAPVLDVRTFDGEALTVGGTSVAARRTLLFFLSPSCPVCKTVLPTLLSVAAGETPAIDVVLASDGRPEEHVALAAEFRAKALPYVLSTELGLAYQVAKLPYAVLIDADGVVRAKGIVNTREHVESLIDAERLGVASIQDYVASVEKREIANVTGGRA
jgi:methylamine dehydrogenase accessory protein MauD